MRHILSLFIALGLAITRVKALDLTPTDGFRELEGVKIPVVFFVDDARKVQWQMPAQWRLVGGGDSLALYPKEISDAAMELRIISRKAAEAPDGTADPQAVAAWIQPLLPARAERATFVREIPSPFLLGALTSRELTFTYNYLGKDYKTSVALVNLDLEHSLVVIIYSRSDQFNLIHDEGTRSMFRWMWLESTPQRARTDSRAVRNTALEK